MKTVGLLRFLLTGAGLVSARSDAAPVAFDGDNNPIDGSDLVLQNDRQARDTVLAIWEKDLVNGQVATSLWDSSFTSLISYSCGNTVSGASLGVDASFDVDNHGFGTVAIGGITYRTELEPTNSGGISCSQAYNDVQVAVHCYLPIMVRLAERNEPALSGNTTSECFTGSLREDDLFGVLSAEGPGGSDEVMPEEGFSPGIDHGENFRRAELGITRIKGDGKPKKWRRHEVMVQMHCKHSANCGVEYSSAWEIVHTAGFSISGLGPVEWISGGYSVSWSTSTSKTYTCNVEKKGQTACIKNQKDFQEYYVQRWYLDHGNWWPISDPFYIWSPMKAQQKQPMHCVINGCPGEGVVGWGDHGRGKW